MNLLFCYCNWMNPNKGGVQRVSDTLAKFFVENGYNVYYLNFEAVENDPYKFPAKLYKLPDPDFFSKANIIFYHELLKQLSIDIIINHDSSNIRSKLWLNTGNHSAKKISLYHTDPLNGLYKLSDFSGNLKIVLSRLLPQLVRYLKVLRKRNEIGFLLKNSDKIIFLSSEYKRKLSEDLKINSAKIGAISNPCISYNIELTKEKKKQILFVARLELAVKRPDKMLNIWASLHDKFHDWELIFLGDGQDKIKIQEMSELLQLKNVRFEGFVDPLPYYLEASIICMTSDYEGFGLVLAEAMQFGIVPMAFNNWVSLKDIINDQENGIIVPSGDILAFSEKLGQLISNDILRKQISVNARESSKKFHIESIGPKWIQVFNELITT